MKMKTITNDKYYVTFKHFCQALDLPKNASGGELIVCQISFLAKDMTLVRLNSVFRQVSSSKKLARQKC